MSKPNLVFMYGEDTFSLRNELKRWKKAFIAKYDDMNLEELDGAKTPIETISSAITAMPFMSDRRLVILKDFLASKKADDQKKIIPLLEKLSDETVFVIAENSVPDKRMSAFKKLSKEATVKVFNKPEGAQLTSWLVQRFHAHGGKIDYRTATYLISAAGNDLWKLENEAQKLSLFAKDQAVTPEMIDQLVVGSIEQSIFTLTDQLAKKDSKGALLTMRKLQANGQEGPYLFAMIARQFRLMLEIKALMEQRMPQPAIASKMKVHPYVVKTTANQCRNFTHKQLRSALRKLLEIDRRLKTGRIHLRQREEEQYLLAIERILLSH